MKLVVNDSIALTAKPDVVGIAESINANKVKVRLPFDGNRRVDYPRNEVRPLADLLAERRGDGARKWNRMSLTGGCSIATG